ncbi:MAG TPA: hypothetical protein VFS40_01035 [Gemmatimonadales bacterium]|nr:hypothetical protein [Gemmatimonadales bacterium]
MSGPDAERPLRLVRDVLDQRVFDRDVHVLGRVDGLALELREGEPPRAVYVELGATTLAARLSARLGRWARRLAERWGAGRPEPVRFAWTKVRRIDLDLHLDADRAESHVLDLDRWLYARFIRHLPGAGARKEDE